MSSFLPRCTVIESMINKQYKGILRYKGGKLHSANGLPAIDLDNNIKKHPLTGNKDRTLGKLRDGLQIWYKNGEIFRPAGPVLQYEDIEIYDPEVAREVFDRMTDLDV